MNIYPIKEQSIITQPHFSSNEFNTTKEFEQLYNYTIGEFGNKPYSYKHNIYNLGKFLENNFKTMNQTIIDLTLKMANDIQNMKGIDNIKYPVQNVINIIFSVIIKKINADDIISGRIAPEYYMKLINKSIELYRNKKIGEEVDYRHIYGRMLSHRKLYNEIVKNNTGYIKNFGVIKWGIENQLDILELSEKIAKNFYRVNKSFITPTHKRNPQVHESLKKNDAINNYYNDIFELLKLICNKLSKINPREKEYIQEITDYANIYAYRINTNYNKIGNIYQILNKINTYSEKLLRK